MAELNQEFADKVSEALKAQANPAAAQPAVESAAPASVEAPVVEAPTQTPAETPSETTFDFSLGEAAKPEVDYSALETRLKQLEEENNQLKTSSPFADERIAKINEYVKGGGEINETFWKLQAKDYSNVDFKNDAVLLNTLKDKYTLVDGFTEKEAERLISKNFPNLLNKEDADPDELIDENINLKSVIKDALPKLQEMQKKASLPQVTAEQIQARQRQVDAYRAEAITNLQSIKTFEVPLMDDYNLRIGIDQNNYEAIKDLIANPEKQESFFPDKYFDREKGKVNFKQLAEDEYFRINKTQILKAVFAKGMERGKAQAIQSELLNERPEGSTKRGAGVQHEKWMTDAAANLKKLS